VVRFAAVSTVVRLFHAEWIVASVSGGASSLWLCEWLTEGLHLRPGMRVLDLGCGRGAVGGAVAYGREGRSRSTP